MRSLVFGVLGVACAATLVAAQVQNTATLNSRAPSPARLVRRDCRPDRTLARAV